MKGAQVFTRGWPNAVSRALRCAQWFMLLGALVSAPALASASRPEASRHAAKRPLHPVARSTAPIDAPVWTATSPGHPTLLLIPTIHRLATDDTRIDTALAKVVARAQAVVFEAPLTLPPDQMAVLMQRYGIYPVNDNVTNHVDAMTPAELAGCASHSGIGVERFLQLKPWLSAVTLEFNQPKSKHDQSAGDATSTLGYAGIDQRLIAIANARKLPVIYLETFERALQMFDAMPDDEQGALLESACHDAAGGTTPGDIDIGRLQAAWTAGDIARLDRLVTTREPNETDALHAANQYLFREGTNIFAASLAQYGYFHGNGPIVIAVGTGHFFGDASLLDRLKAAGYTITPPAFTQTRHSTL